MLKIEGLNKYYGKKHVLKNVNLSLEDGKVHGIIGLNGAGKTTFFKCICGLHEFEGHIEHSEYKLLKNYIGYVPSEPYFFPRVTGREYLEFIKHAKGIGKIEDDVWNAFDLPYDEYIDNYSTGMKRKIAFLGAMVGSSEIYILDEPFNGVDIKSNLVLKKKILELKSAGKTILLSSHITSSLTELCDEIHLLSEGAVKRHYLPKAFATIEDDMINISA